MRHDLQSGEHVWDEMIGLTLFSLLGVSLTVSTGKYTLTWQENISPENTFRGQSVLALVDFLQEEPYNYSEASRI